MGTAQNTMFVYLSPWEANTDEDSLVGGETHFPHLPFVADTADRTRFSVLKRRDDDDDGGELQESTKGPLVMPVPGSAIFWMNIRANGMGNRRNLHGGLGVLSGVKRGMNMIGMASGVERD
ncbi:hypothetical protein K491DRAFT_119146 [Lophiostoma macrostomum CBS 122681]|uniref:Prolyl 4-hydroxylase alpha subunit Fe(2+) 2OG dioxygenase domain-containing protein n=1 Tax=Lophiostoma macrostomum CBS 122681 TaxID=1314788 RepID=A0A6A6SVY1_9PLEO|nr:hypothetical protein K491DRAFT_119146 [Lophiostoma macrostomum CBS 122681]